MPLGFKGHITGEKLNVDNLMRPGQNSRRDQPEKEIYFRWPMVKQFLLYSWSIFSQWVMAHIVYVTDNVWNENYAKMRI